MIKLENISLDIDYREHELIKLIQEDPTFGDNIKYKTETMDVADIIIYVNEKPIYLIERKTISDLNSSLKDGRYREQKVRMKKYMRDNNSVKNILYLLEGRNVGHYKMPDSSYYGVLFNCIIRDRIDIYCTNDIYDTKVWLTMLIKKIIEHWKLITSIAEQSIQPIQSYMDTICIKKKDNVTPEICYIRQLCQYHGISPTIAKRIAEKHRTMSELIKHYDECDNEKKKENMMCEIEGIGKVLSKRIYDMLYWK